MSASLWIALELSNPKMELIVILTDFKFNRVSKNLSREIWQHCSQSSCYVSYFLSISEGYWYLSIC